jgi:hypothetical protein
LGRHSRFAVVALLSPERGGHDRDRSQGRNVGIVIVGSCLIDGGGIARHRHYVGETAAGDHSYRRRCTACDLNAG